MTLSELSRADTDLAEAMTMMEERLQYDDRSFAIIEQVSLERSLERMLKAKFELSSVSPLTPAEQKTLFEGDGAPLGTFSAKIKIGHAIGIFGSSTKDELNRLRAIRNVFAHAAKPIGFSTPEIADVCARLVTTTKYERPNPVFYADELPWPPLNPRDRYHYSAAGISAALLIKNYEITGFVEPSTLFPDHIYPPLD